MLPTQSDSAILARASSGEKEAFGLLYDKYVDRIYNYVYYRVGNQHDAEDLTSKVFIRALRHIENYTDRGVPFSAWLYRIAHNLVANFHRDNSRKQDVILDEGLRSYASEEYPEISVMALENNEFLLNIIQELPANRQQLILLKFVEDMSNAEIGKIMGRTEGAIKSLYHRTLLSLRDKVQDIERKEEAMKKAKNNENN